MKTFTMINIGKYLTLYQDLKRCSFEVSYSYDKQDEYPNLIEISLLVWSISVIWDIKILKHHNESRAIGKHEELKKDCRNCARTPADIECYECYNLNNWKQSV